MKNILESVLVGIVCLIILSILVAIMLFICWISPIAFIVVTAIMLVTDVAYSYYHQNF